MKNIHLFVFLTLSSLFLYACGGEEQNKHHEPVIDVENTVSDNDSDRIPYELPSPLEIARLFNSAGLSYVGDLTSSESNINKLNSAYAQKINFGIYSADMTYCIMNNQTQESINYLNTLRKLSEKLWMTDVFNTLGLRDRLEQNSGETDSLKNVMADLQVQLDSYLDENGMGYTGSIIFAGAWIETMYLGTKANASEKNEALTAKLSEQGTTLDILIKAIKHIDEDNDYAILIADLESLNTFFNFSTENDETTSVLLDDDQMQKLSSAIENLRTKVIEES